MRESLLTDAVFLPLSGKRLEVVTHRIPGATRWVLLLHEALGSVSYWKDFPQRLAQTTGCNVLVYARAGFGDSEGPLDERTPDNYLKHVSETIPALLAHFGIERPIVCGHSEGAGIALMYAAATQNAAALVLEGPMVFPAESTARTIARIAESYPGSKLQQLLARYHREPDRVFYAWTNWSATINPENFRILDFLRKVTCPVLVLQGAKDEFDVALQLAGIRETLPGVQSELYENAGHLIHRDAPDAMLARITKFFAEVLPSD